MDAEALELPDAAFDVVLCALGLMYLPAPEQALREMDGCRGPAAASQAVWGERDRCAWALLFGIVDAEVASVVCPDRGAQQPSLTACTGRPLAASITTRLTCRGCAASLAPTGSNCSVAAVPTVPAHGFTGR